MSLPDGFWMFLPPGRTFDPRTNEGWEAVPYAEALATAIARLRRD